MGYTTCRNKAETDIGRVVEWLNRRRHDNVIGVCSLYANPLHAGHVDYLEAARELADVLVAVVNTDHQSRLKKGTSFMDEVSRLRIVGALACVDCAVLSVDADRSVCKTVELLRPHVVMNGGDVVSESDCREAEVCKRLGIRMEFGVGGYEKIESSSALIRRATAPA